MSAVVDPDGKQITEPTIAVKVAIGALCEVGRPDLAMRVNQNRGGWPSMAHADADADVVVVKAFWMGHVAAGHRAQIEDGGIHCEDCWESYP